MSYKAWHAAHNHESNHLIPTPFVSLDMRVNVLDMISSACGKHMIHLDARSRTCMLEVEYNDGDCAIMIKLTSSA
jgi:hypothetical protein